MPPILILPLSEAPEPAPPDPSLFPAPPLEISDPLDEPFYTGGLAAETDGASVPYNLPVAIGTHRYLVDWKQYERATISPFREARDSSALPGENSLNPLAAWKRSRDDWSLGAGQKWSDRTLDQVSGDSKQLEPRQYFTSKGIDPWTIGELKLHHDTETRLSIFPATDIQMVTAGGILFISVDGGFLYRVPDINSDFDPPSAILGIGDINDMTVDGETFFAATNNGVESQLISDIDNLTALPAPAGTTAFDHIKWANGWLFATRGNKIYEIRADGSVNLVFEHLNNGFEFKTIVGTPTWVYFAGNGTYDDSEIWRVGVKGDGTLTAGFFAGSPPRGEFIRCLGYYAGLLLVGTTKGIHLAAQGNDGSLNMAAVIETSTAVECMYAEGRFVWFGWSHYDSHSSGLGRMDLSAFTDRNNLICAFASDLMYPEPTRAVKSIARVKGKTVFALEGVGIIGESASYVQEGQLNLGRFRWGTFEPKVFLGIEVVSDRLIGPTDGQILARVTNEGGPSTNLGSRGPGDSSTGVGKIYGVGEIVRSFDWYEPTVTLRAKEDQSTSPIVRRVTLRALPVPKTIEQWQLPILMSEMVNDQTGEGGDVPFKTSAEYLYLQQLIAQGIPITFRIGFESYLVTVREVAWREVKGMTSQRDGVQGVLMVTLISAEI